MTCHFYNQCGNCGHEFADEEIESKKVSKKSPVCPECGNSDKIKGGVACDFENSLVNEKVWGHKFKKLFRAFLP